MGQPLEIQNLYLSKSQVPSGFSQYFSQNAEEYKKLFRHKGTKIWVSSSKFSSCSQWLSEVASICEALDIHCEKLEGCLKLTPKKVKHRHNPLIFKANLLVINQEKMLDFRLSKGYGLDFKRHFLSIKEALKAKKYTKGCKNKKKSKKKKIEIHLA